MQSFFGIAPSADVEIVLHEQDARKHIDIKNDKEFAVAHPLYFDGESVIGHV